LLLLAAAAIRSTRAPAMPCSENSSVALPALRRGRLHHRRPPRRRRRLAGL